MIIRNKPIQCTIKIYIQLFYCVLSKKILQYKCNKTMHIAILWNVNENYEKILVRNKLNTCRT